jgi:hypothetical protein
MTATRMNNQAGDPKIVAAAQAWPALDSGSNPLYD